MTANLEAFAELVRSAEAAASCFDGNALSRKSDELARYVEWLLQQKLTAEEFAQVHQKLSEYRDLCAFLQSTLHGALLRAAGDVGPSVYHAAGRAQHETGNLPPAGSQATQNLQPLQPLLRRYA